MKTLILFGSALVLAGQTTAPDACAPKPSEYAPQLPAKLMEGMGKMHFPITTRSTEAQAFFDQGVAQMHSFWATEAERSFRQAAALDPDAPMPQWGIAMVAVGDFRPRFQLQDHPAAVVPQRAGLVEFGPNALADEAAVAGEIGQIGAQTLGQQGAELGKLGVQGRIE